jgi:pimeloyl-ACP methyl ester carboxylesterase
VNHHASAGIFPGPGCILAAPGRGRRMANNYLPILLLSGMAADARLFEPQQACFPSLRVPGWIKPLPGEPLRAYAARMARVVDPGCPCIVGGASFGGAVALEMAPHLQAVACVLIGSIRSSAELPGRWRALRPLASLGPDRLGTAAAVVARLGGAFLGRGVACRLQRLTRPEAAFVRWATCAVLRWQPSSAARRVRVFQIHGGADRTLPVERTQPHVVVPGGSHALTLFNPAAVNEFLSRVVEWSLLSTPSHKLAARGTYL